MNLLTQVAVSRNRLVDIAPACGLGPFLTVLRTRDHEKLLQFTQHSMDWYRGHDFPTIPGCLGRATQSRRRVQFPSVADRDEGNRLKLLFSGDKEDGPPLAWVTMWNIIIRDTYGCIIPSPTHDWGDVFWDAQRLVESGRNRTLQEAWAYRWPGYDPRCM